MLIQRAYKTELDLNNAQRTACARHAGAARWAYNWGLSRKIEARGNGEKAPTAIDLHRELNKRKKKDLEWMYEVSKCAPQEALRNLDRAFDNFFRRVKAKKAGSTEKPGFPRFQVKEKRLGRLSHHRIHPCVREGHPAAATGQTAAQGRELPAGGWRQSTVRDGK